jgi:ribosomal protein S18 acetylase RimI-like enzyme
MNLEKEDVMTQITYRKLRTDEAQLFWNMMTELNNETKFMMYEPGERTKTLSDIKAIEDLLQSAIDNDNYLLVAEVNHQIVGYILGLRGKPNRQHTAYIVTGIKKTTVEKALAKHFLPIWISGQKITILSDLN